MANLSESQLAPVRALLRAASDANVRDLESMLSSGVETHETMKLIQVMVSVEAEDRRARNIVFAPIAPLCAPKSNTPDGLRFPPQILSCLWRALKEEGQAEVTAALKAADAREVDTPLFSGLDELCLRAAKGLRSKVNAGYASAAAALDQPPGLGAEAFAACLDLAPIARAALEQLPDWLGRMTDERAAAVRLTFRDAVELADDASPRLLEILSAHLEEPWLILRIVSPLMNRASDKYAATSELAGFGERFIKDIDQKLTEVSRFAGDGGAVAGTAAIRDARIATNEIFEFDEAFELSPEGPWGARLSRQKRTLLETIEKRLKSVESEVAAALPLASSGFKKRGVRAQPRLTEDPDQRQIDRAKSLLSFMHGARGSADRLGFGSLWLNTSEAVHARIDAYVEDLLEKLRAREETDNIERVRLFLDVAAELLGLSADDKAAQIVRRRMAAAA